MTRRDERIYHLMQPIRKHVPQKVRFVFGMVFVFPVVVLVMFFGVNKALSLAIWDIVKDGYKGTFPKRFDEYFTDRFSNDPPR
jgi:hypothetical protein